MPPVALVLPALYAALTVVRLVLAVRALRAETTPPNPPGAAAILQPILSGDPELGPTLRRNLPLAVQHHLYWLVDDDDPAGQAAAAIDHPNVTILTAPGPRDGENPKVAKLDRAFSQVTEPVTAVLDDDTVITPEAFTRLLATLTHADLVTGLPVFVSHSTIYERFLGGFVNGNALLTYLPAHAAGAQHTINGMIYAARTAILRDLGGFHAIRAALTDDYAIAQLFERAGRRVVQTPVCVHVRMTIRDAAHCARVLRRWFVFANRYLRDNRGPWMTAMVALPSILPLTGFLLGLGWPWLALLAAKALANRALLHRAARQPTGALDLIFEMLADTLSPLFYLSALVRPARIRWRSRQIEMDGERIRYR